jgi:hypothetical protein
LSEIFKRKFFIEEELSEANNQKEYWKIKTHAWFFIYNNFSKRSPFGDDQILHESCLNKVKKRLIKVCQSTFQYRNKRKQTKIFFWIKLTELPQFESQIWEE